MSHPLKKVLDNDICIGCGVCEVIPNSGYTINLDQYGKYKAYYDGKKSNSAGKLDQVCPFSNNAKNEDELSDIYLDNELKNKEYVGKYINFYAGHVEEGDYRNLGSSGGMGTWILSKLLDENYVDEIIHVKGGPEGNSIIFQYSISSNKSELQSGAKSKYYPITLKDVLKKIKNNEKKVAIVGIPCFIKSIRLLCQYDKKLKENIIFTIGLVCGHLKSSKYGEMLAWQAGVKSKDIKTIDFREKIPSGNAGSYGFSATSKNGEKEIKSMSKMFGASWGLNLFKYKACDFCDDVFAETADMVIGDAWIKPYVMDEKGSNVVITRNNILERIIKKGIEAGNLKLDEISYEEILKSQSGGLTHRIKGLKYRLYIFRDLGIKKRYQASSNITLFYKVIFRIRYNLMLKSHKYYLIAQKKGTFKSFKYRIFPLILLNDMVYFPYLAIRKLKRIILGINK